MGILNVCRLSGVLGLRVIHGRAVIDRIRVVAVPVLESDLAIRLLAVYAPEVVVKLVRDTGDLFEMLDLQADLAVFRVVVCQCNCTLKGVAYLTPIPYWTQPLYGILLVPELIGIIYEGVFVAFEL